MLRDAAIVIGTLAAVGVLLAISLALQGCTIERVILYGTVPAPPVVSATPRVRIGPS